MNEKLKLEENQIQLRDTKTNLNIALESANMGSWHIDLKTKIATTSPGTACIFGLQLINENVFDVISKMIHPDDQKNTNNKLNESIAKQTPYFDEYRIIRPDGKIVWVFSKGTTKVDRNGEPSSISGIIGDITERKLNELKLEEERKKLKISVGSLERERDLRERLVASLSHDLRIPLTAAKLSSELLARKFTSDPQMFKAAHRITDNMNRADGMIQDILDVSLIKAGEKIPLRIQFCQMNKILDDVIEDLQEIHGDKFELRVEESIEGYWDLEGIKRIMENLLSNAIKYGEIGTKVTLTAKYTEEGVLLSVHNKGSPISENEILTLFDLYKRSETAHCSGQKGWGLGLTLVKGITESHGGKVSVSSDSVSGTVFSIVIPKDSR